MKSMKNKKKKKKCVYISIYTRYNKDKIWLQNWL